MSVQVHRSAVDAGIGVTSRPRGAALALLALAVSLVALSLAAAPAGAAFGLASFGGAATDAAGNRNAQAGAHPNVTTKLTFNSSTGAGFWGPQMEVLDEANLRDVEIDLPRGLVGNPSVAATCAEDDLRSTGFFSLPMCPTDSQVGTAQIWEGGFPWGEWPLFNVEPRRGMPALFGFSISGVVALLEPEVRAGDYGIRIKSVLSSQTLAVSAVQVTLWGVPADPVHDAQRWDPENPFMAASTSLPRRAFISSPVDCAAGLLQTTARYTSWQEPENWLTASFDHDFEGQPMQVEGCEKVPFHPSVSVASSSRAAGAPSGLSVDLRFPQDGLLSPDGLATAHLRKAVVTLPEGMVINPASADGLAACGDTQLGLGSAAAPACPDAAKIGSATASTPLIGAPLTGSVYLRPQASRDPASGDMFRIALVLRNVERGLLFKLPGAVRVDPGSGRITAVFDDNPQLPVAGIQLAFNDGPRAPLVNPGGCGEQQVQWSLTPWSSGSVVSGSAAFAVDRSCETDRAFAPAVTTGVVNPVAGTSSPLVMDVERPDGQQELGAIHASLPPGLLGVLKAVPLCAAAQGAAGTCGGESRVGKVQVAAGAGAQPLWLPLPGQPEAPVFLTQPYRAGDVAGLSVVVPAVAGPFDLGTVVTKVYLRLRHDDQGIDLQSEPLPRLVGGVPVQIRRVVVTIDRKGFTVTPTSCRAMATTGSVFSQRWAKAPIASRFQVGDCARLPLAPAIAVSGGGKGDTARFRHPSLQVSVRQAAGQAHLTKADVVLPKAFNVDLQAPSLKAACPREVYAQDKCSKVATVGTVRAVTPLLAEPLTGPAFLLQKKGQLPDIVMRLRNSQMSLDLIGVLDFLGDGRIVTRVRNIPDAALSSFELRIRGGKGGSLLNRSDLCVKRATTQATFAGQNGKVSVRTPVTRIAGCASQPRTSRSASARAAAGAHAAAVAATTGPAHQRAIGDRS